MRAMTPTYKESLNSWQRHLEDDLPSLERAIANELAAPPVMVIMMRLDTNSSSLRQVTISRRLQWLGSMVTALITWVTVGFLLTMGR